uniref:Uncharacterized protein n=1 Tax=Latimeria chalumnae TaxID=7897 RepID=H3A8P3_LATCH
LTAKTSLLRLESSAREIMGLLGLMLAAIDLLPWYIRVCGMLSQWCKAKRFGARMAKLLNILEFLQDEAGKGVACITLKFKVSAIGAIGGDFEGFALSSHSLLSLFFFFFFFFFKALHHLKTPFRSIVPSWDLNLVLSTLCEAPLDPMKHA